MHDVMVVQRSLRPRQQPAGEPARPPGGASLQAEPARVLHRRQQLGPQLGLARVLWQQQGVEAGVCGGQAVGVGPRTLDEQGQLGQAADGGPAGGGERRGWLGQQT